MRCWRWTLKETTMEEVKAIMKVHSKEVFEGHGLLRAAGSSKVPLEQALKTRSQVKRECTEAAPELSLCRPRQREPPASDPLPPLVMPRLLIGRRQVLGLLRGCCE